MKLLSNARRALVIIGAIGALSLVAGRAYAQSIEQLNSDLSALGPQVNTALSDPGQAASIIQRLDDDVTSFARLTQNPKNDKGTLLGIYGRLEDMLGRIYNGYKQKKEDCITAVQNGSDCDYTQSEQLSLQALYPLSWLRFQGAGLYSNQEGMAKKLLNQGIDGFTESTLVIINPELLRENLLGRAYCERELGKYDKAEYEKAIADFKQIMADGANTKQYTPAKQGLSTTYAAMGKMEDAAKMGAGGTGEGAQMLHLTQLFRAEQATNDPARKAAYHKEAVDVMRSKQDDKTGWAIVQAAVAQNVRDPIAEFGGSSDPFEKWLLANVLFSEKKYNESAKYFLDAAHSGKYPRGYKYAADIYYTQRRLDLVEQLANEMARMSGPDAQWGSFMRFKLPFLQWEQGGGKNEKIENQWVTGANDYLKVYPKGQYAYEARYRFGQRLQRAKQYSEAAKEYDQVSGNADYEFRARYGAAECNYLTLVEASNAAKDKNKPAPSIDRAAVRKAAIDGLQAAIKLEPAAERSEPSQARATREIRGQAIFMLAGLLKAEPKPDNARIASLLDNYENQYPGMKERFIDVAELRVQALDNLGNYSQLERDVHGLLERAGKDGTSNDFIKVLGLDFWRSAAAKKARGDTAGAAADAKLTAIAYGYFEDQVQSGKSQAKNLTGTLSILGQAYIAAGDVDKAEKIFNQVVKADPGSPDANAGLARIAQAKKNYKDAVELWTRVEAVAAESDDVWYEAKYNIAMVYAAQGNIQGACNKLAVTRSEHPSLGTPEMKGLWDALQRKLCLPGKTAS